MKRSLLIVTVLLIVAGLTVAGFGSWCLGTDAGARWLMARGSQLAGIEISTVELEGSVLGGLDMKGLRIAWTGGEVQAESFGLSLHTTRLWSGALAIDRLAITRLILQTDPEASETESTATTAEAPGLTLAVAPAWLTVTIDRLQINDFIYRNAKQPAEETLIAHLISGRYRFADQRLSAESFSYDSPYVELDGEFDWQLSPPHLEMTAQVHLTEASADPKLFETIGVPIDFPAHLAFDGDWNGYKGPVRFGVIDDAGDKVWLTSLAIGSVSGIRFKDLKARYLGGAIAGNLDLSWAEAFRMNGALSAQEINPAALIEGVTGRTTFDVSGEVLIPYNDQPLQANLGVLLKKGRFRGHALQGKAAGRWIGQVLTDLDVNLSGDGARLVAKGSPAQRVDLDLEVAEMAAFHADLAGQAAVAGWVRWTGEELSGVIDGHGENLAWQGLDVHSIKLHARRESNDDRVAIRFSGRDWRRDTVHLERLEGDVTGTLGDHRLNIVVTGSAGQLEATASGRYEEHHWRGQLEKLTARETPWGTWSISQSTRVSWNDGVVNIDRLLLRDNRNARLEFEVEGWNSPGRAELTLGWSGFALELLQPYAGTVRLDGQSAGQIRYVLNAGAPLSITAQVNAQGQVEEDSFELGFDTLAMDANWDQNGLELSADLSTKVGEIIRARATSSEPLRWHWPLKSLTAGLEWQKLDLARLNRFLPDGHLEGLSEGHFSFDFSDGSVAQIRGELIARGRMLQGERELGPRNLTASLDWSNGVFRCETKVVGARGGQGSLLMTSSQAPALTWPESGEIDLNIKGLSLAALEPWIPKNIEVTGAFDGHAKGAWQDQSRFDLSGSMQLLKSHVSWSGEEGQIRLPLENAVTDWVWRDDQFSGTLAMNLAEHGWLKGSWQLPLPARIPTAFEPAGAIQATLSSQTQAIGILSAVGPWLVQDVRGETRLDLAVQGTWADPEIEGQILFRDGAAYLPAAGIQLTNINLLGELAGDKLHISQLEMQSGPGVLNGQGELIFDDWAFSGYQIDVIGKNFQVVDFPELQVLCNPDLKLSGTFEQLSLQGSVDIPVMKVKGSRAAPEVLPSKDVITVTAERQRQELTFATDVHVVVELGDDVTVSSSGLESQLTGGFIVALGPKGETLAQGEVQMVSGTYQAYGTKLQIRQGILSFGGGPINNPDLRIFAAREVGSVLAGVQVTGSAEAPVVSLYSRPSMPERDILGYILMGRAVRSDSLDSDVLMMGAGTLLPNYGEGFSALGITEIDLQGLFVGLGGVKLRRRFADKWEIESTLGIESGVDLYYIFEFE